MNFFKLHAPDIRTVEGFTSFYQTYLDFVLHICYKYTRDETISEDITSQLFTTLWERRNELHQKKWNKDSWKYYLTKSAKHRVFDHIRSVKRAETHLSKIIRELHQVNNTTEKDVYFGELTEQVSYHIEKLPPKCKEVFQLSRNQGLSNKEIAKRLSISDNTVKTHIANALNYLRESLGDYSLPKRNFGT
ncbi:MAG: RNA polymerase sigma-70 factor [Bacteroidota bacterium]